MKHRVGFIGYGSMGSNYHYQVATDRKDACDDLAPVAVYDVREKQRKLAESRGLKAYDNVEDFLASDEFDFVVVATPNNFHKEMVIRTLKAGKDVLCEKPVALCLEDFDEMVATAKETGKHFFVHQNRRNDTEFLLIKHGIETGRVGKVNTIESCISGGYMEQWRTFKDHGGGMLYDWGVHLIDQMISLIKKKPVKVYAHCMNDSLKECDLRSYVEMTFDDGLIVNVIVAAGVELATPRFTVIGDMGQLIIQHNYDKTGTLRYAKSTYTEQAPFTAYGPDGAYTREMEMKRFDFQKVEFPDDGYKVTQDWVIQYKQIFDCIDLGTPMPVPHEEARIVLEIIEAARKSSETGMPVFLK